MARDPLAPTAAEIRRAGRQMYQRQRPARGSNAALLDRLAAKRKAGKTTSQLLAARRAKYAAGKKAAKSKKKIGRKSTKGGSDNG